MTAYEAYCKCYERKERIINLEKFISLDADFSYHYASDIIKGRFFEGEKIISTNPFCSLCYALHIIRGPFVMGHPVIFSNYECKKIYLRFLKLNNYNFDEISEWFI